MDPRSRMRPSQTVVLRGSGTARRAQPFGGLSVSFFSTVFIWRNNYCCVDVLARIALVYGRLSEREVFSANSGAFALIWQTICF